MSDLLEFLPISAELPTQSTTACYIINVGIGTILVVGVLAGVVYNRNYIYKMPRAYKALSVVLLIFGIILVWSGQLLP